MGERNLIDSGRGRRRSDLSKKSGPYHLGLYISLWNQCLELCLEISPQPQSIMKGRYNTSSSSHRSWVCCTGDQGLGVSAWVWNLGASHPPFHIQGSYITFLPVALGWLLTQSGERSPVETELTLRPRGLRSRKTQMQRLRFRPHPHKRVSLCPPPSQCSFILDFVLLNLELLDKSLGKQSPLIVGTVSRILFLWLLVFVCLLYPTRKKRNMCIMVNFGFCPWMLNVLYVTMGCAGQRSSWFTSNHNV